MHDDTNEWTNIAETVSSDHQTCQPVESGRTDIGNMSVETWDQMKSLLPAIGHGRGVLSGLDQL